MSRVAVTPQTMSFSAGIAPTYNAANSTGTGNGNSFANDGRTYVHVKNAAGSPTTVTVVANGVKDRGVTIPNQTYTVNDGTEKVFGPIDPGFFNNTSGSALVDWSVATGVTFAVVSVPQQPQ